MANKKSLTDAGLLTYTITEDEVINIGEAAEGAVGSWVLHVSGGGTYSITLRKKIRYSTIANGSAPTTYYENHATGVSVAAGTAISSPTLVKVPCDGCALILDVDWTSGACQIEMYPLLG